MRMLLIFAFCALGSACTVTPKTPAETVLAAKTSHAVALRTAVAYKNLPPCAVKAPAPVCSDKAVVAQLQKADKVADAALDSAENVVRTPGFGQSVINSTVTAATAALDAFTKIVATLKVQ